MSYMIDIEEYKRIMRAMFSQMAGMNDTRSYGALHKKLINMSKPIGVSPLYMAIYSTTSSCR